MHSHRVLRFSIKKIKLKKVFSSTKILRRNCITSCSKCLKCISRWRRKASDFYKYLKNSGIVHVRCTYVPLVFCNYFNFPLVVLLRAARKSRGDITAERSRVSKCTYVYLCTARARARLMHSILRPQSSFTRYLAFSFPPFSSFQPSATCARTRLSVRVVYTRRVLDLSRFPADACKSCLRTW